MDPSDKVYLKEFLLKHFNLHELRELVFDLGIERELESNHSKNVLVIDLIAHCKRHLILDLLITAVIETRPALESQLRTALTKLSEGKAIDHSDNVQLRKLLFKYFNFSELRELVFDLGIELESISDKAKNVFVIDLINYCERHMVLESLVTDVIKNRSNPTFDPEGQLRQILVKLLEKEGDQFLETEKRTDKAQVIYLQALEKASGLPWENSNLHIGRINRKIGNCNYRLGQFDQALKYFKEGLQQLGVPGSNDEKLETVRLYIAKSNPLIDLGQKKEATKQLVQAKELLDAIPISEENGRLLQNLAIAHRDLGQRDKFIEYMQEAKESFERINATEELGRLAVNLALDDIGWGLPEISIKDQLNNKTTLENSKYWPKVCLNLSIAYTDIGELSEAEEFAKKSLELSKNNGDLVGQLMAYGSLAEIYKDHILINAGNSAQMRLYADKTLKVVNKAIGVVQREEKVHMVVDSLADLYRTAADAYLNINNIEKATQWISSASGDTSYEDLRPSINSTLDDSNVEAKLKVTQAHLWYKRDKELDKAVEQVEEAVSLFRKYDEWKEVIPAKILTAQWLYENDNFSRAETVLEKTLAYIHQGHCSHKENQVTELLSQVRKQLGSS